MSQRQVSKKRSREVRRKAYRLLESARARSKDKNMPFDLTRDWIEERLHRGVCESTGAELRFSVGGRYERDPSAPSIDRIDSSVGYLQENCRVVCYWVNHAKWKLSEIDFFRWCSAVVRQHQPTRPWESL